MVKHVMLVLLSPGVSEEHHPCVFLAAMIAGSAVRHLLLTCS